MADCATRCLQGWRQPAPEQFRAWSQRGPLGPNRSERGRGDAVGSCTGPLGRYHLAERMVLTWDRPWGERRLIGDIQGRDLVRDRCRFRFACRTSYFCGRAGVSTRAAKREACAGARSEGVRGVLVCASDPLVKFSGRASFAPNTSPLRLANRVRLCLHRAIAFTYRHSPIAHSRHRVPARRRGSVEMERKSPVAPSGTFCIWACMLKRHLEACMRF